MTKSNHTPTPWEIYDINPEDQEWEYRFEIWGIEDAKDKDKNYCVTSHINEIDAALIVHRVNNWHKLVEALEAFVTAHDNREWPLLGLIADARSALKLAKGEYGNK